MNKNQPWDVIRFKGTGSWNSITHKATTAVVDNGFLAGAPSVKFTTAANHNLTAGSVITLDGSTYYDGMYLTLAGTATTLIYVHAKYIAETLTTTDTFKLTLAPECPFEFGGFNLHLDAASLTAEDLTITLDAGAGSVYDDNIYTKDMNTLQNLIWNIKDNPLLFTHKDDQLDFAWANSNTKTYGLEVFWRRLG